MGENNPNNRAMVPSTQNPVLQQRPPKTLQGLLKYAMDATQAQDAIAGPNTAPINEEDRQFLAEALQTMTAVASDTYREALRVLTDKERIEAIHKADPIPPEVKNVFVELLEQVDDIDVAIGFYKIGGFAIFPVCYGCPNDEVRALTSSVLGEICQNNPFCQEMVMGCDLLNVIIKLTESEKGKNLAKTLYALSCATRNYKPACEELIKQNGVRLVAKHLNDENVAVMSKAAFILRHLCRNYPDAKEQMVNTDVIATVTRRLQLGRNKSSEIQVNLLLDLIEGENTTAMEQFCDPNLNFEKTIRTHLNHPDLVSDDYFEEKEACQKLLRKVIERRGSNAASEMDLGAER